MVRLTLENESVEELYEIDLDDINDAKQFQGNMEASSILSFPERHTLSPKNYYPSINRAPTNKYSPIKPRSEGLKCFNPNSINAKSRTIRCMKPQSNLNQVLHHLVKPLDFVPQRSLKPDIVVRRGHIPHRKLLSSGLPNHLVKDIYQDDRSQVKDNSKKNVRGFSNIHNNIVEAYTEEGIQVPGVVFIQDFTTTLRNPEEDSLKYLLNTLLVTTDESRGLTCHTYRTLKHIQHHHKLTRGDFPEDWDKIMAIINLLGDDCNILFNRNRLLYLDLLTTVLEEDLHQHKLENTVRKSFIWIMLCPDHKMSNVSSIINLLLKVVQRTVTDSMVPEENIHRVVFLLQKTLVMSIDVCTSRVDGAMKIAEDLLYPFRNLDKVEHRRQILETIQCDLLRLKLIELWLENCCELKDPNGNLPPSSDPLSVSKIVKRHFRCKPSEDVEDVSVSCEELCMVLYLLLKSYLHYASEKVSASPIENAACYCSLQLSIEDKTWLVGMGDNVAQLRNHLTTFAELTPKMKTYLKCIEVLQDLVDA